VESVVIVDARLLAGGCVPGGCESHEGAGMATASDTLSPMFLELEQSDEGAVISIGATIVSAPLSHGGAPPFDSSRATSASGRSRFPASASILQHVPAVDSGPRSRRGRDLPRSVRRTAHARQQIAACVVVPAGVGQLEACASPRCTRRAPGRCPRAVGARTAALTLPAQGGCSFSCSFSPRVALSAG
jgi:hypothetical protein